MPDPIKEQPKDPMSIFVESIYTMYYRKDTTGLQSKSFRFLGNLRAARDRAERHCAVVGGKLHYVQPFLTNLDLEEDYHTGKIVRPTAKTEEHKDDKQAGK